MYNFSHQTPSASPNATDLKASSFFGGTPGRHQLPHLCPISSSGASFHPSESGNYCLAKLPNECFFSPLASVITLWMRSLTRGSHLELIWRLDSLDTTFSKPTIFISPSRRALPNPSSESASLCRVGTFNRRSTCYFKRNSAIIRRETSFQDSSCYCRRSFPISEMHRVQAHPIISICTSSVTSAVKVTG